MSIPATAAATPASAISEAKLAANRANALLSRGPVSAEGKAKVSLNAVKNGLTGQTVLLPSDDVAAYQALVARVNATWQPATDEEKALAQSIADTDWRLARIPVLEAGIYAHGQLIFANEHAEEKDEQVRRTLIQTRIYLFFEKKLKNLSLQEARLRRQKEKDEKRLRELQEPRVTGQRRLTEAARAFVTAKFKREPFNPGEFGFDFTFPQIIERASQLRPDLFPPSTPNRTETAAA